MRISDWSSDVCSSDLSPTRGLHRRGQPRSLYQRPNIAAAGSPRERHKQDSRADHCSDPGKAIASYLDRKSVVWGQSVSLRVDLGGPRIIKKKKKNITIVHVEERHNHITH